MKRLLAAMAATALGVAPIANADDNKRANGNGYNPQTVMIGAWKVQIGAVDCATGLRTPAPPVNSYLTFGAGGTFIETTGNPRFLPGQRSNGQGYWVRTAPDTYEAAMEAFLYFDSPATAIPPYKKGIQRIEQVIEIVDANRWQSAAVVNFFDEQGTRVAPSGCAVASAVRMQ